jgi:hopene-associated glycosyltransferase HpnB
MIGAWTGLLVARGRFWDPPVDRLRHIDGDDHEPHPAVAVVVPARNEVAMLPLTLPSLLGQRYRGRLDVILADDHSDDGTADRALELAAATNTLARFAIASVPARPHGWVGKTWAMSAGVRAARASGAQPEYWLFTDADIAHDPDIVAALVATARGDRRDLVSLMVALHCRGRWERFLIPAFVFFFAKLFPFAWVADDRRATAAAAGGCILISDRMLRAIGGIERIAGALIDDCSLAHAVKSTGGRLRLELSTRSRSVRPYDSLESIWQMVARSAYTQLKESPALLAGTVAGLTFLYVLPPVATVVGAVRRERALTAGGAIAWAIMSAMYLPVLRRYGQPAFAAPLLPLAATFYTLMTIDSARQHWQGRGGAWKGRVHDTTLGAVPDEQSPINI